MNDKARHLKRIKEEALIYKRAATIYIVFIVVVFCVFGIIIYKDNIFSLNKTSVSSFTVMNDNIPVYKIIQEIKPKDEEKKTPITIKNNNEQVTQRNQMAKKNLNSSKESSLEKAIDNLITLTEQE